jgi:hypothetical protein
MIQPPKGQGICMPRFCVFVGSRPFDPALFLDHEVSPAEIIKWAAAAMYRGKDAGGNVIRFAGS